MEPNFSGLVSAANLKCSDGRIIKTGAFAHQDGAKVPIVYQHNHTDINQVLGYAILKNQEDGVWGDCYLNDSPSALAAGAAVKHGSLDKFSVWAKNLVESGEFVHSGDIQEVSLVLAGANPGAMIYNVLVHGNIDQDEVMYVGGEIVHAEDAPPAADAAGDKSEDASSTEGGTDKTVAEVLDTLSPEQTLAVNAAIDDIVTEAVTEALTKEGTDLEHDNLNPKGQKMHKNAFEEGAASGGSGSGVELKHADVKAALLHAKGQPEVLRGVNEGSMIGSFRDFIRTTQGKELMHAADYGVENIEILFPEAQNLMNRPSWVDRRQEWVKAFMAGTSHSPFARVKTMYADITADEARAKGYIKANQKTDEVFPVFARSTGPGWVIKKQKLDRQDIIDIVDFDVVAWMKAEMRGKLDEEIARAGLFGDGRPTMVNGSLNPDKIKDPGAGSNSGDGIRAIANDHELYATTYSIPLAADATGSAWNALLDGVTEAGEFYMGSGNKTAFMSFRSATKLLTIRDGFEKRMYRNLDEVAGDMDVARIVRVPTELFPEDVLCIVLDLADYNFGTNRGGEITLFDDFDILFNQYHYLIETYLSGALTLPYAAQIFKRVATTDVQAQLVAPTFNSTTGVVTIPSTTGVTYTNEATGATLTAGAQTALAAGASITVEAVADTGYYFKSNDDRADTWTFERPAA